MNLFSGVTYPIVGIVIALILFDGLKEGILLPIFDGMYQPSKLHGATTEISYETSGALVVTRGPFVFRIGYLASRVLLALLLLAVTLPCMKYLGTPSSKGEVPADVEAEPRLAIDDSMEASTSAAAAAPLAASSQSEVAAGGGAKTAAAAAAAAHHHLMAAAL